MPKRDAWNRCDVCGKFIAMDDFGKGALRDCVTDDTEFSKEEWMTLCTKHGLEACAALTTGGRDD